MQKEVNGNWQQVKEEKMRNTDSQFDGFVPHDDVAWETEALHVDNVDVSSFCADVKPFALKGQVAVCDSARGDQGPSQPGLFIISWLYPIKESPLALIMQLQLEGVAND